MTDGQPTRDGDTEESTPYPRAPGRAVKTSRATWLISHPACLAHDTGPNHPESRRRLEAVLAALEAPGFEALARRDAVPATREQLGRIHDPAYVTAVLNAVPSSGYRVLDADTSKPMAAIAAQDESALIPDTVVSPASGEAALYAAGAVCRGVDAVLGGEARRVFCAVRPPGHHALRAQALGFCLFNNIAVAAAHAVAAHHLKRVAIVDFDVHHGNGTQSMADGRPEYLYVSIHQRPLYLESGGREENRPGNICNIPLPPGSGSAAFRGRFSTDGLPALFDFDPELILISAGFDGHRDDPLADLGITEEDYAWLTGELVAAANYSAGGRVVSALEGGYNLEALQRSVAAHVRALMD
ncbi:histone deacetylase family protein [Ectothiorhodospiraceae bacterium WFHF3C12]|nr:histone deacetylase family protein [Ectothiorhodospiraceae bacterium WFHF3C12]